MPEADTVTPNRSWRKAIISYRYMSRCWARRSHNASRMRGVIVLRRPTRFGGAYVLSNRARLDRIRRTVRSVQSTASAISLAGSLLRIMTSNCAC